MQEADIFPRLVEIATHIEDWVASRTQNRSFLQHPSGASIVARIDIRTRRLVFSSCYGEASSHQPTEWDNRTNRRLYLPSPITVNPTRSAEAMAKELTRRLIPQFLPLYDQAVQAQRQADEKNDAQRQVRDEFVALLGEQTRVSPHGHLDYFSWFGSAPGERRSIRLEGNVAWGGDEVDLKLDNLPVWMAKELVIHLRDRLADWHAQECEEIEVPHAA